MLPVVYGKEFLPFLNPPSYKVLTNVDDTSVITTLPTSLHFGDFQYDTAYVSKYNFINF